MALQWLFLPTYFWWKVERCEEVKKICRHLIEVASYEQLLPFHSAHTRYQLFGCYMKSILHNNNMQV